MLISVIIPTRNRARILKRAIESLCAQQPTGLAFELLVVDNASSDETRNVAMSFSRDGSTFQYLYVSEPGLHVCRHVGLLNAMGDVLVYADDDVIAEPAWLSSISDNFADPSIALVGGNNYPEFEEPPPTWLARLWNRPHYKGRALSTLSILDFGEGRFDLDPGYVWGCNFAVRRGVLLAAGGFHPDGMPEERLRFRGDGETHVADYVRQAGLRAVFDSRASVHHLVSRERMTREYFCRRSFAQGISDSYTQIRSAGGIPRRTHLLRRQLRWTLSHIATLVGRITRRGDPVETELRGVLETASRCYVKGFQFHMTEVGRDRNLLEWVLREKYL
jgi:glucosyl-dolichyl phosphate glucuronosyltransferase